MEMHSGNVIENADTEVGVTGNMSVYQHVPFLINRDHRDFQSKQLGAMGKYQIRVSQYPEVF